MRPALRNAAALAGAALALAGLALAAGVAARPALEERIRARIETEARSRGMSATVGEVRLGFVSVQLRDVVVDGPSLRARVHEARVRPRLSLLGLLGRAATIEHDRLVVELPAGLRLALEPTRWVVESGWGGGLRLAQDVRGETLELTRRREGAIARAVLRAEDARLSGLVDLRRHGCLLADLGTITGGAQVESGPGGIAHAALQLRSHGFALAALDAGAADGCAEAALGERTDVEGEAEVTAEPGGGFRVERFRLSLAGVESTGRLSLRPGARGGEVDLAARFERLDFARLLAAAGLDLPADDLGSASLSLRVQGPLADPSALRVQQELDFTPPSRPVPAIERLKGPFVHHATASDGHDVAIDVSPESPDYVALDAVPPLFVRTLLIGEDAGFWGHRGIDLRELPAAVATNLARGTFARGASTITQQLAKNLFLSREKKVGRKLVEASLALLLDAALGKPRVLEIYLNVIEWGPGVYGLRPAARHYFGRDVAALTPKQVAFLVAIVPGPVKYQRSIEGGVATPFLEGLMANLLVKAHSVGAIDDAQLEQALGEPLSLVTPPPAGTPSAPGPDAAAPPAREPVTE